MWGPLIIAFVLVVFIPVSVMMSGAGAAGILGFFLKSEADKNHEGSELIETNR